MWWLQTDVGMLDLYPGIASSQNPEQIFPGTQRYRPSGHLVSTTSCSGSAL